MLILPGHTALTRPQNALPSTQLEGGGEGKGHCGEQKVRYLVVKFLTSIPAEARTLSASHASNWLLSPPV